VYDRPLTIEQALTALTEQPQTIAALTSGLTPAQLCQPPGVGEWSMNDVLAHLRSCADMWGKYIAIIVAEDHPTIRAVSPRTWIDSTDYPALDFDSSFAAFTKQRAELIRFLQALPKAAWARSATVTGAGAPYDRTLFEYAQWLANHERSHIGQIGRLAGRQSRSHASSAARNPSRSSRKIE
jgi:DinB family protein